MSATSGLQALPYPQPSDAPDGPGAFLALIQRMGVGGIGVYDLYSNMTAALGTGYQNQFVYVYNDISDNNGLWMSNGVSWSIFERPWVNFTATTSGLTLGSGGSTLYSKYKVSNGELTLRIGWRLGTSPTVNDVNINYPIITVATWLNDLSPAGQAVFYDASAGVNGRIEGTVYKTATTLRVAYKSTTTNTPQLFPVGPTVPFTWTSSDELHITATYPI